MKISKLINKLEKIIEKRGDLPIYMIRDQIEEIYIECARSGVKEIECKEIIFPEQHNEVSKYFSWH